MALALALSLASLLPQEPALLFTLQGPGPEEFFGSTIVETQDLDGDGRPDLGFGSSLGATGRFTVLSSADRSVLLDVAADRIGFFAFWIGDATGDGVGELLTNDVANNTLRQSIIDPTNGALVATLVPNQGSFDVNGGLWFGPGPDVNGDGALDFWLRTRTSASGARTFLEVRSGASPTTILRTLTSELSSDNGAFASLDVLPDFDGDGVDDWLVGDDSVVQTSPSLQRGRVLVFSGATGQRLLDVRGDATSNGFGSFVRTLDDLNGDGRADFLAYVRRGENTVEVFSGADGTRLYTLTDPIPNPLFGGDSDFGETAAALGDVDGDGIPDFCVGAPGSNEFVSSGGAVFVYSGASGDRIAEQRGLVLRAEMGRAVFTAGDVDGDGRGDWLVGSPMTSAASPSFGMVEAFGFPDRDVVLDFELADDFATPLPNGAALDRNDRFGRVVRISSSGSGQVGPAAFDSSPAGPNAAGPDPDLLVDRGNVLILQQDPAQSVPGIYDVPNDAALGGVLTLELIQPSMPLSLVLIDADDPPAVYARVRLIDGANRQRRFTVPGGFTTDATLDPGRAARALRLDTLADQPGAFATATADEDLDFDPTRVTRIEIELFGSGAVDDVRLAPGDVTPVDASRLIRRIASPTPSQQFASEVEALGDIDGDGLGELAIGSGPASATLNFGRVTVHRGVDGTVLSTMDGPPSPTSSGTFGSALAAPGDLDGDGRDELLVGAFFDVATAGGPRGFVSVRDAVTGGEDARIDSPSGNVNFGAAIAAVGDIDGDGVRDFAVGANQAAGGLGEVRIFSGADRSLLRIIAGDPTLQGFGSTLVNLGDVDGDGFDEIGGFTDIGFSAPPFSALRVHSTRTGALVLERRATQQNVVPGYRLAPMGDLDGDGRADFAEVTRDVGSGTNAGALRILSGGTGAVLFELLSQATTGLVAGGCASPGDLDGDGVRDLVYYGVEPNVGPVPGDPFVAALSGADFRELFRRRYSRDEVSSIFEVDAAGDVDGDGFGDIAVTLQAGSAAPIPERRVEVIAYVRIPASVICIGEPNSSGSGTRLRLAGSTSIAANQMALEVMNLPAGSFTVVAVSKGLGQTVIGSGLLCLDTATLLRVPGVFGGAPIVAVPVDLTALPTAGVPGFTAPAVVGETRYFQAWYRDTASSAGSNLSDALAVLFLE